MTLLQKKYTYRTKSSNFDCFKEVEDEEYAKGWICVDRSHVVEDKVNNYYIIELTFKRFD